MSSRSQWRRALWVVFAVFVGPGVYAGGSPAPVGVATAWVAMGLAMAHAGLAVGWRTCGVFLIICLGLTFSIENLGVATGFPFGRHRFLVGAGLPHVGAIPVIVGFLYFGIGYPSWVIAGVLLRHAGLQPEDRFGLVALPVVASLVLVQWDVVVDPVSSTLGGAWVWLDGGGYFGVPFSNYLGWYLTTWAFFQLFAFWQYATGPAPALEGGDAFWLMPILLYAGAGLCHIAPLLVGNDGVVADASGARWRARDPHETTVIVMMATMLTTSGDDAHHVGAGAVTLVRSCAGGLAASGLSYSAALRTLPRAAFTRGITFSAIRTIERRASAGSAQSWPA